MCFAIDLIGRIVDHGEGGAEVDGLLGHRIRIKIRTFQGEKMTPGLILRVSVDTPLEAKNFSKSTDFVTFILILMSLCAYCVHKYRMKNLLFLLLFFFSANILAQSIQFTRNNSLPVKDYKGDMANPWAGGFNSVQFSTIDVNGDGRDDLFTFDRTNQVISVFSKNEWDLSICA